MNLIGALIREFGWFVTKWNIPHNTMSQVRLSQMEDPSEDPCCWHASVLASVDKIYNFEVEKHFDVQDIDPDPKLVLKVKKEIDVKICEWFPIIERAYLNSLPV
jgi:hypothetical protein